MSSVQKRPDAWRFVCDRCGAVGEWRDRKYVAAWDHAAHETDEHGGALRALQP